MANTSKPVGAPAASATAPVKYPLARLRRDCRKLYGVSTSTFDGATVGYKPDEKFTVAEMGDIIKVWKDAPIQRAKTGKEGK